MEARNARLQYRRIGRLIPVARGIPEPSGHCLRISPKIIRDLHRAAIRGIYRRAGHFREWPVSIGRFAHRPPEARYVDGLVQDLCDRANEGDRDPVETAAFLLWKLNWIHPFGGGNGRTARALTHLALCVRLGYVLPGNPTIGEYVNLHRLRYMEALRDADRAWQGSNAVDVGRMTGFLNDMLEEQLGNARARSRGGQTQ